MSGLPGFVLYRVSPAVDRRSVHSPFRNDGGQRQAGRRGGTRGLLRRDANASGAIASDSRQAARPVRIAYLPLPGGIPDATEDLTTMMEAGAQLQVQRGRVHDVLRTCCSRSTTPSIELAPLIREPLRYFNSPASKGRRHG